MKTQRMLLTAVACTCLAAGAGRAQGLPVGSEPPNSPPWWHLQVKRLWESGHLSRAVDAAKNFERSLAGSHDHRAWFVLGRDYQVVDEPALAVGAYGHLLQMYPDDGAAWTNMGIAEQRLGRNDAAIADYNRGAALGNELGSQNAAALRRQLAEAEANRVFQLNRPRVNPWIVQENENIRRCGKYSCP